MPPTTDMTTDMTTNTTTDTRAEAPSPHTPDPDHADATNSDDERRGDLALDVRGLHCAYGDFKAVRGIDLSADHGELLAVLGTNGAGKTTAFEALQGRHTPTAGRIRVLGLNPIEQRRRLAARIGVMLQDDALAPELTPAEFLGLWQHLSPTPHGHRPVRDNLARVGLAHRSDVRIRQLSGGERRRLDLAVAVSNRPELLFLDEPTAGLDPTARAEAWDLLRDLMRHGTTIVMATHHLEEADALADRLAILHQGRVEASGTLDDIVAAGDSRIRCKVPNHAQPPHDRFIGRMDLQTRRGHQQLEISTPDLDHDLDTLLAWAREHQVELSRLQASEPTLAEVFPQVAPTASADPATTESASTTSEQPQTAIPSQETDR